MSAHLPIRELAKGGCLPTGQTEGVLVILRAYFDDSGTHTDSSVTLIGGLIGTVQQWDQFEAAWAARLADPLPGYGKPPLRMFHLSDCVWRKGEFSQHSEPEASAVRHDFRKIILDAKLTGVACAVDKRSWDDLVVGPVRSLLGDSVSICSNKCLEEIVRFANPPPSKHHLAVWFDRGIETEHLKQIAGLWTRSRFGPMISSVNFARVECVLPLQGADIVATEHYWHTVDSLKIGDIAAPSPHLRDYHDNMLHQTAILDRAGIEAELSRRGPDGLVLLRE